MRVDDADSCLWGSESPLKADCLERLPTFRDHCLWGMTACRELLQGRTAVLENTSHLGRIASGAYGIWGLSNLGNLVPEASRFWGLLYLRLVAFGCRSPRSITSGTGPPSTVPVNVWMLFLTP